MPIVSAEIFPVRLPMRESFTISRGSVGSPDEGAPHVYLRLDSDNGISGWGEARPSHRWSYETLETVVTTLQGYLLPAIMGADVNDLIDIHARMEKEIAPGVTVGQPIAKSAVDMAALDMECRGAGRSMLDRFGGSESINWPVACIVSADSARTAGEKAGVAAAAGFK